MVLLDAGRVSAAMPTGQVAASSDFTTVDIFVMFAIAAVCYTHTQYHVLGGGMVRIE